ncbi:MAG: DUF1365 family protein [Gammaproteobacteria bacterium]|nr:DUF1365 family protein [Gammaproteobacteria bacterium]
MKSCIYTGNVWHARFTPAHHDFAYQMAYLYADLDELDEIDNLSPWFSIERFNVVSFHRQDYLPSERPLADEVKEVLRQEIGETSKARYVCWRCPDLWDSR